MKTIDFTDLQANAAQLIGKQWMLVSAGSTPENFNCMTASWGGLGFLWNRPVAFVFVRPNRHTHTFIEKEGKLTLSFMPEKYRQDLVFCGRNSGRDVDKMAATSLQPIPTAGGSVGMADADVLLECRVMYSELMSQSAFTDWAEVSPTFYAEDNPLHTMLICEITAAHVRE